MKVRTENELNLINILVFGTGGYLNKIESYFKNCIHVLAYVDNNLAKENDFRKFINKDIMGNEGAYIICPDRIVEFEYDYIVIASQYCDDIYTQLINLGVSKEKILKMWNLNLSMFSDYSYKIDRFISKSNVEVLVTGLSYTYYGIDENKFIKNTFDFSNSGQDLFYDFKTIKYLNENYADKIKSIKYAIIGLSYYSFQYDMSLSSYSKDRVLNYYNILKEGHNFKDVQNYIIEFNINKNIADKVFKKNIRGHYEFNYEESNLKENDNKHIQGKEQAEKDCKKNYPATVQENTYIFEEYLKLLQQNNIKPIVVVFPASKYYIKYFSPKIEKEFNDIINESSKKYKFQYFDYFRSDRFDDNDFYDVSHLNLVGAKKITMILNDVIRW